MKALKQLGVLLAALVLALALAACGNSSSSAKGQYQGWEAREPSELEQAATDAIGQGKVLVDEKGDASRSEKDKEVAKEFAQANEAYRKGDYDVAASGYEGVLEKHPLHGGANANIVLALLQQGKNEEALALALRCVYLYPEEAGCYLNAQTAATACGYGAKNIEEALDRIIVESNGTSVYEGFGPDATGQLMRASYDYNKVWNRVETELYAELHPAKGSVSQDDVRDVYHTIVADLTSLSATNSEDKDMGYLKAYLEAVGKQLDVV